MRRTKCVEDDIRASRATGEPVWCKAALAQNSKRGQSRSAGCIFLHRHSRGQKRGLRFLNHLSEVNKSAVNDEHIPFSGTRIQQTSLKDERL